MGPLPIKHGQRARIGSFGVRGSYQVCSFMRVDRRLTRVFNVSRAAPSDARDLMPARDLARRRRDPPGNWVCVRLRLIGRGTGE
jgi:hypothetical protein